MRFRIGLLGQTLTVTLCQLPRESLSNTGMRRLGCQQLLTHNLISVMHACRTDARKTDDASCVGRDQTQPGSIRKTGKVL